MEIVRCEASTETKLNPLTDCILWKEGREDKTENCITDKLTTAPVKVNTRGICILYERPPVRSASDGGLIALRSL